MDAQEIDFSCLDHRSEARTLAIKHMEKACQTMGCFHVVNHGVDGAVIHDALDAVSEFFELSAPAKSEFASEDMRKPVRYCANSGDGIGVAREFCKLYAHPLADWIHLWPLVPQSYREKMGKLATEARRVALHLMDAILESLGLDKAYLGEKIDEGIQVVATNSYPKNSQQDVTVGLASHSDFGFITIVFQSCQGLQVMDRSDGAWREVPQLPWAMYVQIGDQLEVLSNGRYKSKIHRAILNSEKKRISIASIHGLPMDAKVGPAKELVDEQNPERYRECSFSDFLDHVSTNCITKRSFINVLKL